MDFASAEEKLSNWRGGIMRRNIVFLIVVLTFVVVAIVGSTILLFYYNLSPKSHQLMLSQKENIILYAKLDNGFLVGNIFNQNPDATVMKITVEAVPKDEKNPFNKYAPRFFDVAAVAAPRSMSTQFKVETGPLNPEFHSLRISDAIGFDEAVHMSVGTGIFLSALVFAFLILYLITRDRWRWRRVARWSLVIAGSFALLVALGGVGTFVYEKVRNMPRKQTAYAELMLGMTMPEVIYVKGYPPHVVENTPKKPDPKDVWPGWRVLDTSKDLTEGQNIEDYSSWSFDQDNQNFRIDVVFDVTTKTVNEIACYSQKVMSCPPLLGIDDGMSEETIIERLGKPSQQSLDGVAKRIEYKDLGVWFYLTKKTIYMMGVKDFGSSKGN